MKHVQFKEFFLEKENNRYDLRNIERYEILKTKSERFKKSTVVQMQYLANKLYIEGKIK